MIILYIILFLMCLSVGGIVVSIIMNAILQPWGFLMKIVRIVAIAALGYWVMLFILCKATNTPTNMKIWFSFAGIILLILLTYWAEEGVPTLIRKRIYQQQLEEQEKQGYMGIQG